MKGSLEESQRARDYAQAIIATMWEPLIVLDGKLRVVSANEAYYRIFRTTPEVTDGGFFYELGKSQWNVPRLRELLSKDMLEDLGLTVGLKSLCEDFSLSHDLECDLHLDELGEFFSVAEQISIYRIFQEALDNISRHAAASKVTFSAKSKGDAVEFLVEDNGRGFDPAAAEAPQGVGLAAMAERVTALGGTFKLESQIAVGTRIFFTIPKRRK